MLKRYSRRPPNKKIWGLYITKSIRLAFKAKNDGDLDERAEMEDEATRKLKRLFGTVINAGGEQGALRKIDENTPDLESILTDLNENAIALGLGRARLDLPKLPGDYWLDASRNASLWLRDHVPSIVNDLNETSREIIRSTTAEWAVSGESLRSLQAKLKEKFGENRAKTIAVTAATEAYAQGNKEAWKASGVVKKFKFHTVSDGHVCPICAPKNGQVFDIDEKMPPLHARCRCFVTPVIDEDAVPSALTEVGYGHYESDDGEQTLEIDNSFYTGVDTFGIGKIYTDGNPTYLFWDGDRTLKPTRDDMVSLIDPIAAYYVDLAPTIAYRNLDAIYFTSKQAVKNAVGWAMPSGIGGGRMWLHTEIDGSDFIPPSEYTFLHELGHTYSYGLDEDLGWEWAEAVLSPANLTALKNAMHRYGQKPFTMGSETFTAPASPFNNPSLAKKYPALGSTRYGNTDLLETWAETFAHFHSMHGPDYDHNRVYDKTRHSELVKVFTKILMEDKARYGT